MGLLSYYSRPAANLRLSHGRSIRMGYSYKNIRIQYWGLFVVKLLLLEVELLPFVLVFVFMFVFLSCSSNYLTNHKHYLVLTKICIHLSVSLSVNAWKTFTTYCHALFASNAMPLNVMSAVWSCWCSMSRWAHAVETHPTHWFIFPFSLVDKWQLEKTLAR